MEVEIFFYAVEVRGRPLSGFSLPFGRWKSVRKTVYFVLVSL
jgi:hypothetical protein